MPETRQKNLARAVKQRKNFLEKLLSFSESLVIHQGKMVFRDQGSCNTHTKWRLDGFGSFSFLGDFGQTMMGGNNMKIWYRRDIEIPTDLVLDASWQATHEECGVKKFDESFDWQRAFMRLIKNKDKIIAKRKLQKEKELKKISEKEKRRAENLRVNEEAKKLGIKV